MKKFVSFFIAFAIMLVFAAPIFAAEVAVTENIGIIYNGEQITYDDAVPEEIDGRVMLPFRKVLETMGAAVDYNEVTNSVSAVRGDTSIAFTIGEDTISVNNGGVESVVESDVPIIEKNGRTLVPVRFISNALGMKVGWDDLQRTVRIADIKEYLDELARKAPNCMKLLERETPVYNTNTIKLSLNTTEYLEYDEEICDRIDLNFDVTEADGVTKISGVLNAHLELFFMYDFDMKDEPFEIIDDGDKLYIKSDIIKKIYLNSFDPIFVYKGMYNDLSEMLDGKWMCIEKKELLKLTDSGALEDFKVGYERILKSVFPEYTISSFETMLEDIFSEYDSGYPDEKAFSIISVCCALDKYIKVTDNGVEIKIDDKASENMLKTMWPGKSDFLRYFDFVPMNVNLSESFTENELNSNKTAEFIFKFDYEPWAGETSLDMMRAAKNAENIEPIVIPEDTVDLLECFEIIHNNIENRITESLSD